MSGAGCKFGILLLDDEIDVISDLKGVLEGAGYKCVCATSCESALDVFQADDSIGIVVINASLPNGSGLEALRAMKSLAASSRLFEAIAVSGQSGVTGLVHALRAGFSDCHVKPIDPVAFLQSLRTLSQRLGERLRDKERMESAQRKLDVISSNLNDLTHSFQSVIRDLGIAPQAVILEGGENLPVVSGQDINVKRENIEDCLLFSKLSSRQLDVVRLIRKGMSNDQIASELGISLNTVKLYVSQSLRLTGLYNRTQLAVGALPKRKSVES